MWSLGGYAVELSRLNARRGEFPQLLEWAQLRLASYRQLFGPGYDRAYHQAGHEELARSHPLIKAEGS
jgi:hypothetical protein